MTAGDARFDLRSGTAWPVCVFHSVHLHAAPRHADGTRDRRDPDARPQAVAGADHDDVWKVNLRPGRTPGGRRRRGASAHWACGATATETWSALLVNRPADLFLDLGRHLRHVVGCPRVFGGLPHDLALVFPADDFLASRFRHHIGAAQLLGHWCLLYVVERAIMDAFNAPMQTHLFTARLSCRADCRKPTWCPR
jgi:hypothetical protein